MDPYQLPAHIVQHLVSSQLKESISRYHFTTLHDLICIPTWWMHITHGNVGKVTSDQFTALKRHIITDIGHFVALAHEQGLAPKGSISPQKERIAPCHILLENVADHIPEELQPVLDLHKALTLLDLLLIGDIPNRKNKAEMEVLLAQCKREFLKPVQQVIVEDRTAETEEKVDALKLYRHRTFLSSMILVDVLMVEAKHGLMRQKLARCNVATLFDVRYTKLTDNPFRDWSLPDSFEVEELRDDAKAYVKKGKWPHLDFFLHNGQQGLA